MKNLRKYLGTTAFAFFLAFAVAGTPNAPATVVVPSSGEAHAVPALPPVVIAIGGWILGGLFWDGVKWVAGLPWGAAWADMTASHSALIRGGQGHMLAVQVDSTSTLNNSAH